MHHVPERVRTRKKLRGLIETQARQSYHGRKYSNRAWFIVSEYVRLMHLKEIGVKANFEEIDDFTMNCFMLVGRVFQKCREDKQKQEDAKRKAKGRR